MSTPAATAAPRPGDISDVRHRLWEAVEAAASIVADPQADHATRLRGVHGVTQAAQAYLKVLEAVDFEARLAALEAQTRDLL